MLSDDTLSLIVHWIQYYYSPNDILITKVCMYSTCKFLQSKVTSDRGHKKPFFQILTLSSIDNQEIFHWFYNPSQYNNIWTFCYSCIRNDLKTLAFCRQNCIWSNLLCPCEATHTYPIVDNQMRSSSGSSCVLSSFIKNQTVDGFSWGAIICALTAESGHLDMLKYLHENGCPWDQQSCQRAAFNGHLDVLKYLHENGCDWNQSVCCAAAIGGHLDVIKYLHLNGCPWDQSAYDCAAMGGHLHVLQYLHENGCPWDHWTCCAAAMGGHIHILKYLHENGWHWDRYVYDYAALYGHLNVVKYLNENGCPWDHWTCLAAFREGNIDIVKYFHENGCSCGVHFY